MYSMDGIYKNYSYSNAIYSAIFHFPYFVAYLEASLGNILAFFNSIFDHFPAILLVMKMAAKVYKKDNQLRSGGRSQAKQHLQ